MEFFADVLVGISGSQRADTCIRTCVGWIFACAAARPSDSLVGFNAVGELIWGMIWCMHGHGCS